MNIYLCNYIILQFIITDDNEMYVWGASPQALRLQYQAKKRANATRKHEEEAARQAAATMAAPAVPMVPIIHHSPIDVAEGTTIQTTSVDNNFELVNVITTSTSEPESLAETQAGCGGMASTPEGCSARTPRSKSVNDLMASRMSTHHRPTVVSAGDTTSNLEEPAKSTESSTGVSRGNSSDEDNGNEHMYPTLVDTSEVEGDIIQVNFYSNKSNSI